MSDGHFRSLQPRNGQGLHEKSASKKSPHFEKKWSKNPPSYEPSPTTTMSVTDAGDGLCDNFAMFVTDSLHRRSH